MKKLILFFALWIGVAAMNSAVAQTEVASGTCVQQYSIKY